MMAIADRVRVSIRTADRDVDLAVAAHLPLRDLLPGLLDAAATETGSDVTGRAVCLSHPLAGPLDAARSLAQAGVRDGDLLVLTDARPPRVQPTFDPCAAVAAGVRSADDPTGLSTATLATALIGWAAVLAASMLGWPALAPDAPRHVVPTFGAGLAALLGAWVFQRRAAAQGITIGLAVGACGFAALAGWLAVPGGPASANATLALSACAVVALAASRVCGLAATTTLHAVCVASASAAVPALGAVLQWWPAAVIGPVLVAGWLAVLSAAPRLVARALSAPDAADDALRARTLTAHRRLTAAVVTAAGGTALGCLVTAVATPPSAASTAMLAAAAAILLLRMRVHAERRRAAALAIGAALVSTTLFGTLLVGSPGLLPWLCGVPAAAFAAGVRLAGRKTWCTGRYVRRIASAAEFAAAVAIAPLGCWASGLFGAVRELSFP